jgi:hypothetical protein
MPALFGSANPNWKGGTWVNSKGYVMILVGRDHPMATCRQYAPRCRAVCYEHHGPPAPGQHCHHIDGDKQNDAPENLAWRWPVDHGRYHLTPERARELGRKGGLAVARIKRQEQRPREKEERRRRRTRRAA